MSAISVIIPAYNAEKTILDTIKSVRQQTFLDWEIIVINDGSTDGTLKRISEIKDERIKVFSYENSGVAVARNRGIYNANGEYIAFLDADDLWTPDKLELQLKALQKNPKAGVAYSWTYYVYDEPEGKTFPGDTVNFNGNVYADLLQRNFLSNGSNPLVRKKVIDSVGKFDSNCVPCEDWDFYLRLAACCFFVVVPKHQIFYRQSSNSGSSQVEALQKGGLLTIEKAYQTASPEFKHLKNKTKALFYQYCTQQYLKNDVRNFEAVNRAKKSLWKAISLHPSILLENYARDLIRWLVERWILAFLNLWLSKESWQISIKNAFSSSIFYKVFKQCFLLILKSLAIIAFIPSKIFTRFSFVEKK